jgi:hypothetical protein
MQLLPIPTFHWKVTPLHEVYKSRLYNPCIPHYKAENAGMRENEPRYSYGDSGCNIRKNYPWARGK